MKIPFRLRIALLSASISGIVLLGFGAASWFLLYQQKLQSLDTQIRALGTRHPGWLANRANFDRFDASLQFIFGEEHQGRVLLLVKDADGQVLYRSPGWPAAIAPEQIDCSLEDTSVSPGSTKDEEAGGDWQGSVPGPGAGRGRMAPGRGFGPGRGGGPGPVVFTKAPKFITAETAEGSWRLGVMGNDDLRLVVGLDYSAAQAELNRVRNMFLATIPLALLLVGAGGWWVAGRALIPLRAIAQTAEQVTARGLDQRVPVSEQDPEIQRLILVLNGMMDRLEASFRQATRFSADASHELKTPLAIMQGELENEIQNSPQGSPQQRVFGNLLEETQQLKRITGNLLLLAQADSGQLKLASETILLSEEIEAMIEDAQILASDSHIRFDLDIKPGIQVRGDLGLLRMAVLNLIKNATVYNESGGSVGLSLHAEGKEVELTISNTGPGIPQADQPRIFDRFYRARRADAPSADGLGLGLSLAREIVLAHHGTLTLQESRPGRTCFRMSLKADVRP